MTYFAKGSIIMINEQITKFRINISNKRDSFTLKETIVPASNYHGACGSVWSLKSAGLPLYSRGAKTETDFANPGREIGVYGKASSEYYSTHQKFCEIRRVVYKRSCEPSAGRISQKERLWLRGIAKNKFACLIVLIDWARRNFLKFIDSWFRIGQLSLQTSCKST